MTTNRIQFIDQNDSAYLPGGDTPVIGGAVIKAPRGKATPSYIPKGGSTAIKALFGSPSMTYPDIQEAIEFNNEYGMYISAPAGVKTARSNYFGGIYITTEGSIESFYQVTDPETPNFHALLTAGNTNSTFTESSTKSAYAHPVSAGVIVIDDIDADYFVLNKVQKVLITYPSLSLLDDPTVMTTVSCVLDALNIVTEEVTPRTVGALTDNGDGTYRMTLTGHVSAANFDLTASSDLDDFLSIPANYATLSVKWVYDIESTVIQTLYQNSPRATSTTFVIKAIDLAVNTPDSEPNPYYNTMRFSFKETDGITDEYTSEDLTVSTNPLAVDGYNQSLYVDNVLNTKHLWYIGSKVYLQYSDINETYTPPITKVVTGERIIDDTDLIESDIGASLDLGWDEFADPAYEGVDILFDNTGIATIKTKQSSLRSAFLKTSTFLSPILSALTDTATAVAAIVVARGTAPKTLGGLGYTCNEFMVRDANGKDYWSSIIGSVAVNYARIMDVKLGGAAPMYTNDGQNLGGQLNRSVKKQKYKLSAEHLDTLDAAGVNPIILDSFYGLMLTSQKTAASNAFLTDWSFFGHSMAFDLLKKEIKRDILIPQLGKAISPFYLELRQAQTETIVNKRLFGATAIWTDAKVLVNDTSVNNDETKMQTKFVVKVRVKVTPFTEYIDFILNNVSQNVNI